MKIFSPRMMAVLILQMEYLCLFGLIKFTDGTASLSLISGATSASATSNTTSPSLYWPTRVLPHDIDECNSSKSECDLMSTICINTIGNYTCSCKDGFAYVNETACMDIDECNSSKSECDLMSTVCINTIGNYKCRCKDGFTYLNETSCMDIDECNTCQSQCDAAKSTCNNTVGSYRCQCRIGYRSLTSTSCTDVDECSSAGQSECNPAAGTCVNTAGSYSCSCMTGYKQTNSTFCTDIDECISGESKCDLVSTDCINTLGTYTCSCKNGFAYLSETTCLGAETHRIGIIVGPMVGIFVVILGTTTFLFVFCWKRRRQPQDNTESSGAGVADPGNTQVYETLGIEMTEYEAVYTQMNAPTRLPVPPRKSKQIVPNRTKKNVRCGK